MSQQDDDFYVGYMPKAPKSYSKRSKIFVALLVLLVPLLGFAIATSQWGYWDVYNGLLDQKQLTGQVVNTPVPAIKVIGGKDIFGSPIYHTVPLVGYGKFGVNGLIDDYEAQVGQSLENLEVTIEGAFVYGHGKMIFELSNGLESFIGHKTTDEEYPTNVVVDYGETVLKGEIIDPKCYFGAMSPGEAKPHRACAIRCISGGIPPVFKVENESYEKNYYFILGPDGEPINQEVLSYVADPVAIKGRVGLWNDWYILYIDPAKDIQRL